MMNKTIFDVVRVNTVLHKLIDQQVMFPINTAYKLLKLKDELDEIESLIFARWTLFFGEDYNIEEFNEEQKQTYNLTLSQPVNIDIYNLTLEEIIENKEAKLSIQDIEILSSFFNVI